LLFLKAAGAVTLAVLAEVFAIDLATSPERIATYKVLSVVLVLVGAATLAGRALLTPWIEMLPSSHRKVARAGASVAGLLLVSGGVLVLTNSIVSAERRLDEARAACISAKGHELSRELRLDEFTALDSIQTRSAELLQLADKRVRLSQEKGLSGSERKARRDLLERRSELARDRQKRASDNYAVFLRQEPLFAALRGVKPTRNLSVLVERYSRALRC
jgi:hypothetical protein